VHGYSGDLLRERAGSIDASHRGSACSGEVDTDSPTRICAKQSRIMVRFASLITRSPDSQPG